jgi:uncharacterized membrane protein
MRNMMGSWGFVFGFFAVMILWALVNTVLFQRILHHRAFDPYPYILLNLFLSMMAGVQAAALLIAAKRSDSISSEVAIHTANNTDDIKRLIEENTCMSPASARSSAPTAVTSRRKPPDRRPNVSWRRTAERP